MLSPSPFRVRFLIVGIFSLFALGFALPNVYSQPGRPGGIGGRPGGISGGVSGMPGGITGRPPGGISGMPAGISGMPGGIAGRPPGGITGIGGSGITGMPAGVHGIGGTGISGIGGGIGGISGFGGRMEYEWSCSRCNAVLGRGPTAPSVSICPSCSARLSGSTTVPGGIGGIGGMPSTPPFNSRPPSGVGSPTFPASTDTPPPEMPPLTPNSSGAGNENRPAPSTSNSSSGTGSSSSSGSSDSGDSGRTWKIIGLVVAGVFFLLIVTMLVVVLSNSSGSKPTRHRKPKPMSLDDDD